MSTKLDILESFIYSQAMHTAPNVPERRTFLPVISWTAVFAVAAPLALLSTRGKPHLPWHSVVVLLPAVPLALMVFSFLRGVQQLDELKKRVFFEAIAFSALGTAFLTFSYGFLQTVGWPALNLWCVWGVMGPLWLAGLWVSKRRYE